MVDLQPTPLDVLFNALSDPTRRALVATLARGPRTVGELAEPFDLTLAAVSKHLKVLGRAGLVEQRRHGRKVECALRPERLRPIADWVTDYETFWSDRLAALDRVVREDAAVSSKPTPTRKKRRKP
jgi:DNA-binding transcriptional ArsR family regulator